MTGRDRRESGSSREDFNFKFLFEKIFACYVVPCAHSACILYIMAAATMRVHTSIYSIAIMGFVVCDLLAWAGTTLGLLLCAPSFFETLLQPGMTEKLYVWKGISMAFEILILLMLVLIEVIKKERVIDCICVCVAIFLFSGVLGTIFIKYFYATLEKIKHETEKDDERGGKRALHDVPSVSVGGYQGNISQNNTDFTQPSIPDFDGSSSNPTAPFAPPHSRALPIADRPLKSKDPYKNEKLLNNAKEPMPSPYVVPTSGKNRGLSPTGNEVQPDHPLAPPAAPFSNVMPGSPPKADAPLYAHNDEQYFSSDVSDQAPPPMLAFPPPETNFRAPFDHASNDFTSENLYNNHRM